MTMAPSGGYSQDQGITSDVHSQYVGQIVFSDQPVALSFKNEVPSLFKSEFSTSGPIYARVFAAQSLANTTFRNGKEDAPKYHMYDLHINGHRVGHKCSFGMYRHIPKSMRTYYTEDLTDMDPIYVWTTWRHYLLPDLDDEELSYGNRNISARAFVLALLEAGPGTHNISLDVYGMNASGDNQTEVIATGSFSLSLSPEDMSMMTPKYVSSPIEERL